MPDSLFYKFFRFLEIVIEHYAWKI